MQGLCRIFASNPTQCNVWIINGIRRECRALCRVCRIFVSPLFMYVDAACRCISFMTSFSGAPLLPQLSLNLQRNPKGCSINYGIRNVLKKVLTFWSLFASSRALLLVSSVT